MTVKRYDCTTPQPGMGVATIYTHTHACTLEIQQTENDYKKNLDEINLGF